jgi:hypothetical protein
MVLSKGNATARKVMAVLLAKRVMEDGVGRGG